ncbi:hypothetical protein QOT17_000336 [Balamuthia mandrillaris]
MRRYKKQKKFPAFESGFQPSGKNEPPDRPATVLSNRQKQKQKRKAQKAGGADNLPAPSEKLPASLRRVMNAKQRLKEGKKISFAQRESVPKAKKERAANNNQAQPSTTKESAANNDSVVKKNDEIKFDKQRPGETFHQYTERLNRETKEYLIRFNKRTTNTALKRKEYDKKRKEKLKAKRQKRSHKGSPSEEEEEEEEGEGGEGGKKKSFNVFEDQVAFGEVVDRPPDLTVKPKIKGSNNPLRPQPRLSEEEEKERRVRELYVTRIMQNYKAAKAKRKEQEQQSNPSGGGGSSATKPLPSSYL